MISRSVSHRSDALVRGAAVAAAVVVLGELGWWHPVLVVHACGRMALDAGPLQFAAVGVVALAASSAWRAIAEARRALRATAAAEALSARQVAGWPATWVVPSDQVFAFTAGWLAPRVFVSQAALDQLSPAQRDAVLEHEHCHRRRRDPLRRVACAMLAEALFFVPGSHRARRALDEACEMTADQAALAAAGGRRAPLAGALLAFDAVGPAGVGVDPSRVDRLLDGVTAAPVRGRFVAHLASAGLVVVAVSALGALEVAADSVLRLCLLSAVGAATCAVAATASLSKKRR